MGILRFNRLINKLHTKRLSILVLVLIIPLLFFNFKYLKAFYDDIKTNTKELTFEVKNLDGKDIQEKQDKLKVVLVDKKREIEEKIEKQNMDMQINDYIVDNNSKENDLVYSSNQFSILVDDRLF
jgi:maltodextrin utilization protein YvdJ